MFNCDSSGVGYLLDSVVCSVQYMGSTKTPLKLRFNTYKTRRFRLWSSVTQMDRPVISNCGSITEHISEYLDHHLNPFISFTRSYVKDTNHLLAKLAKLGSIPHGAFLYTADVVGIYPSIPHGEGLGAMREALDGRVNSTVATDTLFGLVSLVLNNNYFEFNGKIYRQKRGTAIGKKCAPAYAILFMSMLEERLLEALVNQPLVWMRFINDVFFIWTHGRRT